MCPFAAHKKCPNLAPFNASHNKKIPVTLRYGARPACRNLRSWVCCGEKVRAECGAPLAARIGANYLQLMSVIILYFIQKHIFYN
jgi:hypothetical protein